LPSGRLWLAVDSTGNEIAQQLLKRDPASGRDQLKSLTTREKQVFLTILNGLRDKDRLANGDCKADRG
jgi:hypothetical protein